MHFVNAKSLLTRWNGINIYRGCIHGCVYCDSRSKCYHFAHPFNDVEVKQNSPELLEKFLKARRKKIVISSGSMSDPYQPCEKNLMLMRNCLELIDKYNFGASVITKSDLILRDIEIFKRIHSKAKSVIQISLTIANEELSRKLEPNVCTTKRRYEVLKEFQKAGIPAVVWLTPLLPFLTDTPENLRAILDYCFDSGVKGIICFNIGMTLRDGSREYYYNALDKIFPGLSEHYRKIYGNKYQLLSKRNEELMKFFHTECEKHNVLHILEECFNFIGNMDYRTVKLSL